MPSAPTHPLATRCLLFSLLSWTCVPGVFAVASIYFGHKAAREIEASAGAYVGLPSVAMGMVIAYANLVVILVGGGEVVWMISQTAH